MTTPPFPDHDQDAVAAEAVDLVVLLMSGEATDADGRRIAVWRSLSPAHDAAFREAVRAWRGLHRAAVASREAQEPIRAMRWRASRRMILAGAASATAAAAAIAVVRPPLDLWPSLQELTADYRTAKGERRTIALEPDVSLELNTLTSLAVLQTSGDPRVELIAGEALIETRLSPGRRLTVAAGDGAATASEARFNIRCIDGVATVTCLEGAVDVRRRHETTELGPSQRVAYAPGARTVSTMADVGRASSWTDGLLIFSDRPLASVVAEVNRYRPGRIVIVNPELGRRAVNGSFRIDRLESFVAQVEQLFGARATTFPGGLTVLS